MEKCNFLLLYFKSKAKVCKSKEVYQIAEMIVKVKEPLAAEYDLIQEGQILFTYFHFASSLSLTKAMMEKKAICIAYETVEDDLRRLPLLTPMSEVAGRMSIQQGAKFLEKPKLHFNVSMGIYAANIDILKWIPKNKFYGFDNLMKNLIKNKQTINISKYKNNWLDIGRPLDYHKANKKYKYA